MNTTINFFIFITVVLVVGILGYWYINSLKSDISALNTANAELSTALENSNATIIELKKSYEQISSISKGLQEDISTRENDLRELSEKFKNLEQASLKHPKMTEKVINKETLKTLKCIESIAKDEECL